MQKIHYTVFSQAYYVQMKWGYGCPSGGIKRFGDLCHKHKIPVTWLVSPQSARCEQEMFTSFHEQFGDEIAMFFRFPLKAHHLDERTLAYQLSVDECRRLLRDQKQQIERYLPWARIKVAGQGIRTPNLMTAAQQEGIIGFFGHCAYQIGVDSITDYGMPWTSFPLRKDSSHLPVLETLNEDTNLSKSTNEAISNANNPYPLVTYEWTCRDLNRSFHTARAEVWSTDPNDVERGGICTDTNVEYWKGMYREYERSLPLNPHGVWFQFHQEAHEMTWGEICKPFTEARVEFTYKMMDLFFEWLVQQPSLDLLTATQAAELYQRESKGKTIPMYAPFAWVPVPDELDFWRQVREGKDYAGHVSKHAHIPNEFLFDYLGNVFNKDPVQAMRNPPCNVNSFSISGGLNPWHYLII